MSERQIDADEPDVETLVRRLESQEAEDDATRAMDRRLPWGTELMKDTKPEEIARLRGFGIDNAPVTAPSPISLVDTRARPVQTGGFDQRYEPRAVLGVGGMGEVRLCKDKLIGREVALKVMHGGPAAEGDARDRFVREARIQGQLEHPSIVPVYDFGIDPKGGIFFTMKRVRGMTLHTVLVALAMGNPEVTAKYSRRKLLTAFGSVCLAVDFAHRRGVLHRDLKPANIILGDFGEVYVLDWGLAKLAGTTEAQEESLDLTQESMHRTMTGSMIGTPGYMSPEQMRGELDRLDVRTDVYSLGAILFEILAGEPLHPTVSIQRIIGSTIQGTDARPSARGGPDVPPELDAICVRATALLPADRYASARALSDALEGFLDGDRNVQLRRDLSKSHVDAAHAALAQVAAGGEAAHAARTTALREVGSALALDPQNPEALQTMANLLMHVPAEVPREAEPELRAAAAASRKEAARVGANRFLLWSAFIPIALWMGIRHIPSAAASIATVLLCGATAWWMSRLAAVRLRHGFALLLLSSITIAAMSALFGPFVLVPGLVATNTMFFAMNADRPARRVVIAMGVLAIALPFFLEIAGVVPEAYAFRDGLLQVLPRATNFPKLQTMFCLLFTSLAMVIIPGISMGRMRDALTAAERRLFLQAWHLRQLVPTSAQKALSSQKGSRG